MRDERARMGHGLDDEYRHDEWERIGPIDDGNLDDQYIGECACGATVHAFTKSGVRAAMARHQTPEGGTL